MAFPNVEEAIESANPTTAATTHTVALPTATAGQLLLIISDKGSTSATVNAHASLTELLDENSANGLYIAYRFMDGTEPASYDLVTSASTRLVSIAYRISAARLVAPTIGTTGSGTSATPDPPASAAPGSTQDYLFIAFAGMAGEEADDDTWGNTPPTNYTPSPPRQKSCGTVGTNLGGLILSAERQLNTGSAQDPGTFGVDVSAAWRSQTITIEPATPQLVTPGVATLTMATFAPTATVTSNQSVTPGTVSLTLSTFAPTVTASDHQLVTPGFVALSLATFAPTVTATAGSNQTATPDPASLTLSTFAPAVSTTDNQTVSPSTTSLALTSFAPVVTASDHQVVTPSTIALSLTAFAPNVVASDHKLVTPATASLTLNTFAPSVGSPIQVTPSTIALTLSTFAPTVSATQNQIVVPPTTALLLTAFTPSVVLGGNMVVTPDPAALVLSGLIPTVSAGSPGPWSVLVSDAATGHVIVSDGLRGSVTVGDAARGYVTVSDA